jgi:hypothetical protein
VTTGPFSDAVRPAREQTNREGDFIRMSGTPSDQAFQFRAIILNRADLNEFRFDELRISHERIVARRYYILSMPILARSCRGPASRARRRVRLARGS